MSLNSAQSLIVPPIAVMILVAMAGPLALNIFLPALPQITQYFDTDYQTLQWSFTLYLLAVAIGQLVMGPLSDRFGRRAILLFGLTCYFFGSFAAAIATDVLSLVVARILQGFGGCAGMVISRTIVLDVHKGGKAANILGYILMGIALAPAIAPSLGGIVAEYYSWQGIFLLVAIFALIILLLSYFYVHETHFNRSSCLNLSAIGLNYLEMLSHKSYVYYMLSSSFFSATFFGFVGAAPYVVVNILGGTATDFGLPYMTMAFGVMLAGYIAGRFSEKVGNEGMIIIGGRIALLGTSSTLLFSLTDSLTIWLLFLPMALFSFGRGLTLPNIIASALVLYPKKRGAAVGLMGFSQLAFGACFSQITAYLVLKSTNLFIFVIVLSSFLAVMFHQQAIVTAAVKKAE
ncbi:MAG: multidrug effflux MFS transporter [Colwellia sp.]|nr:multidrug effflux MFS transporter [Colwellia sp.]MCW8863718.1 multidrug effflux MFS transporter [Colwellia sp.]MCW9081357.1 multidrug effflux MFS transporter [Colwellia sp.]